jgi:hypothetical protein
MYAPCREKSHVFEKAGDQHRVEKSGRRNHTCMPTHEVAWKDPSWQGLARPRGKCNISELVELLECSWQVQVDDT